jgi:hypothetical protein
MLLLVASRSAKLREAITGAASGRRQLLASVLGGVDHHAQV